MITVDEIVGCVGCRRTRAEEWVGPINTTCDTFRISTKKRLAAFMAQIAHESLRLTCTIEIWGPTAQQRKYEPPGKLAAELGNINAGDGRKYCGRGLIMTTGAGNYIKATTELRKLFPGCPDFLLWPRKMEEPMWAAHSSGLYWDSHGCNELADTDQFNAITRKINGGQTGAVERRAFWQIAKAVLRVV